MRPDCRDPTLQWLKSNPSGALRLALRLPIYLYRLNLDWLQPRLEAMLLAEAASGIRCCYSALHPGSNSVPDGRRDGAPLAERLQPR
jgi:hypothetical protein